MDRTPLTNMERDVLKTIAGEVIEGLTWGAAMTLSLEFLEGAGYIKRHYTIKAIEYVLTEKGLKWYNENKTTNGTE